METPIKQNNGSAKRLGGILRTEWPRYLIEIVVIILSITLSFMLDSLKDESDRREQETVYLRSLQVDIGSDIQELEGVIAQTQEVLNAMSDLMAMSDEPGSADKVKFATDLKQSTSRPGFFSKDATFSDLRSSGNMQLIRDMRLKAGLFSYYREYETLKAVELSEREIANSIVADYINGHFVIKNLAAGSKGDFIRDGVTLAQILADPGFTNTISIRLLNRKELLDGYQGELELAKAIKLKLDSLGSR